MGIGVTLHGYIECPGHSHVQQVRRVSRLNRRTLSQLPEADPDWPFITRGMFSMLPLRRPRERRVPQYETQLIHFAGEYKDMWVLEADWVVKFERLLSRLIWDRAVVLLNQYVYEWCPAPDDRGERFWHEPPLPPVNWTFRCFTFDRSPTSIAEAIDGALESTYHIA